MTHYDDTTPNVVSDVLLFLAIIFLAAIGGAIIERLLVHGKEMKAMDQGYIQVVEEGEVLWVKEE